MGDVSMARVQKRQQGLPRGPRSKSDGPISVAIGVKIELENDPGLPKVDPRGSPSAQKVLLGVIIDVELIF